VDAAHYAFVALAAFAAGGINAIAGGGSLVTFPVLLASGFPAITASITNTVGMCPGYFGATLAQRRDLAGQGRRGLTLVPFAIAGSFAGAFILLQTTERSFNAIVPYLLLFAALLLALQGRLRKYIVARSGGGRSVALATIPIALAAVYGAYFGAGMGVMILALIAVVVDDTLLRANALKQALSFVINTCAAIVFVIARPIEWWAVLEIAIASLFGGLLGGKIATRVPEALLRWLAIAVAVTVAIVYFVRG
jgi:uncharacterized membrane protein YfcA